MWGPEVEGKKRVKVKVWCRNNVTNRPLYLSRVAELQQEILQGRWRFNFEPIIIGKTGLILNGQHQAVALILAEEQRTLSAPNGAAHHWQEVKGLTDPLTIDKLVCFGAEEDDETVNTMDTCKPRSLADVIYRSSYFKQFKLADRKTVSKMLDYAVRMMWERTGVKSDPFASRKTFSEALDFVLRHNKMLEAVSHIFEEYGIASLSKKVTVNVDGKSKEEGPSKVTVLKYKINCGLMSPGYASALLYLMGTSASDGLRDTDGALLDYKSAEPGPNESMLDFSHWDKAIEFWRRVSRIPVDGLETDPEFQAIREAFAKVSTVNPPVGIRLHDKIAVLSLAWQEFVAGNQITMDKIIPDFGEPVQEGLNWVRNLLDPYSIGGIDLGNPMKKEKKEKGSQASTNAEGEGESLQEDGVEGVDTDSTEADDPSITDEEKQATQSKVDYERIHQARQNV